MSSTAPSDPLYLFNSSEQETTLESISLLRRWTMELVTLRMRNLWNDWELRLMVLSCLALQTILILVGNRRKFSYHLWIRIVTWCAYLSADSLATVALGILSSKLGDVNEKSGKLDERSKLMAFWAPCLLLLLGGPDNITAYALEDNELWLRHLLGVAVQTGVTAYIYLMAWSVSYLSLLSLLMTIAGLIKYGERTWVLWLASSEKRRESMLAPPDPSPNYPRFMEEYSLKKEEGYDVTADEIIEIQIRPDYSVKVDSSIKDADKLVKAYRLIQIFKRLFAKLILTNDDRDASRAVFNNISFADAFEITAIELGFMYDMLYSKAIVLYSKWGFSRRLITFSITCYVLASFPTAEKHHHENLDLMVTYLLLVGLTLLEIYSIAMLLSSDWTDVWLITSDRSRSFLEAVPSLQICKQPRWSNHIGQFSLQSFCLKKRPLACPGMLKFIKVHDKVERYHYTFHEKIPDTLKSIIFGHVENKCRGPQEWPVGHLGHIEKVLEGYGNGHLTWSIHERPLDQIIIIWHVATELCYYSDRKKGVDEMDPNISCLWPATLLSRYMFYLLVMCPSMLPSGIGQIRLRDTIAEATKFFQERQLIQGQKTSFSSYFKNCCSFPKHLFRNKKPGSNDLHQLHGFSEATEMLLKVNTEVHPSIVKGGRSKSVLFDGCIVAQSLDKINGIDQKWEMISNLWAEILLYAAFYSEADHHAQQLRRSGELVTHVWLILAHFGLTDHFQMTEAHAIARMILR